jgi:hypothetical protein
MQGNIFVPNMQCSMNMFTVFALLSLFAQRVVFRPKREERREGWGIMKVFVILIITRCCGYKIMVDEVGWEWSMHVRDDQNACEI